MSSVYPVLLLLAVPTATVLGTSVLVTVRGLRREVATLRRQVCAVPDPAVERARIREAVTEALAQERERELAEARAYWAAREGLDGALVSHLEPPLDDGFVAASLPADFRAEFERQFGDALREAIEELTVEEATAAVRDLEGTRGPAAEREREDAEGAAGREPGGTEPGERAGTGFAHLDGPGAWDYGLGGLAGDGSGAGGLGAGGLGANFGPGALGAGGFGADGYAVGAFGAGDPAGGGFEPADFGTGEFGTGEFSASEFGAGEFGAGEPVGDLGGDPDGAGRDGGAAVPDMRRHPSHPDFRPGPTVTDRERTLERLEELAATGVPLADVRPGPLGTLDVYVFADSTTVCVTPGDRAATGRLAKALLGGETTLLMGGSALSGGYTLTFGIGQESVFVLADRVVASL